MTYRDLVPIGSGLLIGATSFGLGVIYAQWPYDLNTLWRYDPNGFDISLAHYTIWGNSPMYVHYVFHFVMLLGLIGSFIKLYKPEEDAKYFEYFSLGLYVVAIIIYLTNLRIGVNSCITGDWGEVDRNTGINVMAASEVMIIVVLVGVLVLQGGLYYAEWYNRKIRDEFYEQQAAEEAKSQKEAKTKETADSTSSGAEKSQTKSSSKKRSSKNKS
ncbi:uncharacterized protein PRCAT00004690001 [Priceomyces carsonii]|uniref:uncharacterized protein n=1 Tax=Priceomyces carsonii TaxID=28549 RepID=UPI002ED7DE7C|nr:unnamed protein product [Priceomyces carsonii]